MVDLFRDGYPIMIFSWLLFAISSLFFFVRLWVQLRFRYRPWRELFVVVAWLMYLDFTISISLENDWDVWNDYAGPAEGEDPDHYLKPTFIVRFQMAIVYKIVLYGCKASLLCFYHDITQRRTKVWQVIVWTWPWLVAGALFQVLQCLLICLPLDRNWDITKICSREEGTQNTVHILNATSWAIHLFTDVIVYILPFFILAKLHNVSINQKLAAYSMFALGFFNIASAVVLLVYQTNFASWNGTDHKGFIYFTDFLVPFQLGTALIIVCLPYCRRFKMGTKAKDLRPELNTGNMTVHIKAAGADLEACTQVPSVSQGSDGGEVEDVAVTMMEKR